MRAAIYCRISRDAEGLGLGVKRQEADCRALIKQRGWEAGDLYVDNDTSAYTGKPRPEYLRLLSDMRAGRVEALVAWDPDRLHRSPLELEEFIDLVNAHGMAIATVNSGEYDLSKADGRLQARIRGSVARHESEKKSERGRRKHHELAERGIDVSGGRPFGYEKDRRELRPSEADLIREAAQRIIAGESLRGICRDWNARAVPTVTGAEGWTATVLKRVLVSGRISGRREVRTGEGGKRAMVGRIVADSNVPAIISPGESDLLRALLGDGKRRVNTSRQSYLLTGGLARCGLCGKALVARPRADKRRCYVCASGPGFGGCGKIRSLADPLEALVEEAALLAIESSPALLAALRREDDEAMAARYRELAAVEAQLSEFAAMLARGQLARVEWEGMRGPLRRRQEVLQHELREAQRAQSLPDFEGRQIREAWATVPLHVKRAVLGVVLEAVTVGPAVRGRNRFDPDRVHVTWRI